VYVGLAALTAVVLLRPRKLSINNVKAATPGGTKLLNLASILAKALERKDAMKNSTAAIAVGMAILIAYLYRLSEMAMPLGLSIGGTTLDAWLWYLAAMLGELMPG
jgi:hypothetical protein